MNNGWIASEWSYPDEILKAFYAKGFRYVNYSWLTDSWPVDSPHDPDEDMYYYYKNTWAFEGDHIRISGTHDYVDKDGNFVETFVSLTFVRTADDYTHTFWYNYTKQWQKYEFYRDGNYYEWEKRP
jgi:hypothetical protein